MAPLPAFPHDLNRVIDYCIAHYLRELNYYQARGCLFFSIFQPTRFVAELGGPQETLKLFAKIDARLRQANLPPMHWNGMVSHPKAAAILE